MSALAQRRIVLDDPHNRPEDGPFMEFRLTYAGPLMATQRDAWQGQPVKHAENKHSIRAIFHSQLKELWAIRPGLRPEGPRSKFLMTEGPKEPASSPDALAAQFAMYGFNFVPLVTQKLELICGLDILFLRPDRPGSLVWAGDIDNRLKTLLDALRIPEAGENYVARTPDPDQKPFFVLLEDDKLITRVSVETDWLLEPVSHNKNNSDARVIITVRLRPYALHVWNMHFG